MSPQFISTQKSRFTTTCEAIGNINLVTAMLIPVLLGLAMLVLGLFLEFQGQHYLLKHGSNAVIKYFNSIDTDLNLVEYIGHACRWQLNSFGGNQQGIGIAVLGTTPLFGIGVFACRAMQGLSKQVSLAMNLVAR